MKIKLVFLICLCSITLFAKEVDFLKSAQAKNPINYSYQKNDTYKIYVKPLHQTIITFGADEVEYAETGDNVSFHTVADKHSIRLKVIDENLTTDLVVKTNRAFYYFKVRSTYDAYNPMINFLYPQDEALKVQQRRKTSEPLFVMNLEDLNYSYSISRKYSWTPTQIFDNGKKTVFIMPYRLQEMPVFHVRNEDKEYSIVTFRVQETEQGTRFLVLDRVFEEGVMKLGNKKVIIKNKNYQY
ncbi:MAG: TrbG/VirB9 family P-type conjugative transfer protein [Fusobacterium necrophorum]|nr:TrbG/VirB9 family P-type conjugative transfer protein [Fusobacterium necrophorum]